MAIRNRKGKTVAADGTTKATKPKKFVNLRVQ